MKQSYPNNPYVYEFMLFDHHREYQLPRHPHVSIRTMWNGSDACSIIDNFIELCCPDYPMSKPSYQHVSDKHLYDVMQRECPSTDLIIEFDPDVDVHATIYRIMGRIDNLKTWAKSYANEIKRECHDVGADDGFYDYFPTFLEMFYCVCRELNLRNLYDLTMQYVLHDPASQYYETDDAVDNCWTD